MSDSTPTQAPHYTDSTVTLYHQPEDGFSVLASLPDASVDAVVTDPPYGLEFMGKAWDGADGFRRSLNPNDAGRDNAFGRTSRTSPEYRTASKATASRRQEGGISQATAPSFLGGLNPKCLACDKWQRGANPCRCESPEWTRERLVRLHSFQTWCEVWAPECLRVLKPGGHMLAFGGTRTFHRLTCAIEDAGFEVRDSLAWLYGSGFPKSLNLTNESGERTGWGTALKPAFEPIVVARKPLAGTVAANVLAHGTGALNIDGCRIESSDADKAAINAKHAGMDAATYQRRPGDSLNLSTNPMPLKPAEAHSGGRWPANAVLDESQAEVLDAQSGEQRDGSTRVQHGFRSEYVNGEGSDAGLPPAGYGGEGGASRFFYVAKADASERVRINGTAHPTVKPLALMRWLVRLVTPPGGTVLEPFAGSGTTVEACILEGFRCVAIEREADYLPLIVQRINRRRDPVAAVKGAGEDGGLFDLLDEESA